MVGDKIQYEFIAALPSPPPQLSVTDYPFTPGGGTPQNFGWGCAAGSQNPDPILDQNI